MIKDFEKRKAINKIGFIFLCYAVICFLSSMYFNSDAGEIVQGKLGNTGGEIGPIDVKEENSVYKIIVRQKLNSDNDWSFVSGDVLDQNKNYLFGFGDEFWKESGVDSDGRWQESKSYYDLKVTFPKKGIHYLNFNTEMNRDTAGGTINITVEPKHGSSLAHFVLGVISLIIFIGMFCYANMESDD